MQLATILVNEKYIISKMNVSHMDKNDLSLFQKYCEKTIGKLTEDCIEKFRATKDEESRIKLLYDKAVLIPINVMPNNGKNSEVAQQEKVKGNSYFAKKDYTNALKAYNKGIIKCPQDTVPARELLSILISNRSATYFELKEYKRVFNDIDYLLEVGNYPSHLQYKIWLRKAKCYDAMQNERLSSEAYNEAVNSLKHSKLDEKTIESKLKEIENARMNTTASPAKQELIPVLNPEIFVGGKEYIAAHPKIIFEQDNYQGRFATAVEDIEAGAIIVEENAHCAVVDSTHILSNCQFCSVSVDQPVACSSCGNVVFCCTNCERLANKTFHKIECSIQESVFASGASINCSLALRIISQRPFSYFIDKKNKFKDYLKDNCKKNTIKKKIYRFDDYDNLGKYFPFETNDGILTDDELFIGSLILRHLQLLQFNAHEISELKNSPKPIVHRGFQTNYENTMIGAALYPTLALFNHSCDPSIVRYNIKNKIVVRTIKPVKAGDTIYENYGPLYMAMSAEKRKEILKTNYWFECLCIPCVELWPMFDEMNEYELRIPCQKDRCPYVFVVRADDEPFMTCEYCHSVTTMFPHLKGLMCLEVVDCFLKRLKYVADVLDCALNSDCKPVPIVNIKSVCGLGKCVLNNTNLNSEFYIEKLHNEETNKSKLIIPIDVHEDLSCEKDDDCKDMANSLCDITKGACGCIEETHYFYNGNCVPGLNRCDIAEDCPTNAMCFKNTCVCQKGFFMRERNCIAELGMQDPNVEYKNDNDCPIKPGKLSNSSCYCKNYWFNDDANRNCIKNICLRDNECNINERCLNEKCECAENFSRNEDNICLPNIGASCGIASCAHIGNSSCVTGTCNCDKNYVGKYNRCLKIADHLHDSCEEEVQCQRIEHTACGTTDGGESLACICVEGYMAINNTCYQSK
ncbi:hypothetical protein NQ314_013140, partial [Rhamnusium bicolor]